VSSYAAPPMLEERALSRRQLAEEAPGAPAALADMQSAPAAVEPDAGYAAEAPAEGAAAMAPRKPEPAVPAAEMAKRSAKIAAPQDELELELRKIVELRRDGRMQDAENALDL